MADEAGRVGGVARPDMAGVAVCDRIGPVPGAGGAADAGRDAGGMAVLGDGAAAGVLGLGVRGGGGAAFGASG